MREAEKGKKGEKGGAAKRSIHSSARFSLFFKKPSRSRSSLLHTSIERRHQQHGRLWQREANIPTSMIDTLEYTTTLSIVLWFLDGKSFLEQTSTDISMYLLEQTDNTG